MADPSQVMQFFANGVSYGAILALAAIGLSLVYGILNLSNFAHGDMVALGAFATLFFARGIVGAPPLMWALIPAGVLLLVAVDAFTTRRLAPGAWRGGTLFAVPLLVAFGALYVARMAAPNVPGLVLFLPLAVLLAVVLDVLWLKILSRPERLIAGGFATVTLALAAYVFVTHGDLRGGAPFASNAILALSCLTGILAVGFFVLGTEFAIWRPLRRQKATTLTLIIVSIGLALIIRNALQIRFTGSNQSFNRPGIPADRFLESTAISFQLTNAQQVTIVAALLIIAIVHVFLKYTRSGKAMRALADNPELARVTGIDVDRQVIYVWLISGALVTVAGLLLSLVQNNTMNVNMGFAMIIPLFASVILGGIGSAYGAMLGGFVVGAAMKTSALWLGTKYELASAFIILILVLVVRPQGLLGGKV